SNPLRMRFADRLLLNLQNFTKPRGISLAGAGGFFRSCARELSPARDHLSLDIFWTLVHVLLLSPLHLPRRFGDKLVEQADVALEGVLILIGAPVSRMSPKSGIWFASFLECLCYFRCKPSCHFAYKIGANFCECAPDIWEAGVVRTSPVFVFMLI